MAVKVVRAIPGIENISTKTDLAARKELLIKDFKEIVSNRIENCEIVDIGLSRSYGKSMLEALIRRWCFDMFGRTLINYHTLAAAFTVVVVKEKERYRYFIHFDPNIWKREISIHGSGALKASGNTNAPVSLIKALMNDYDNYTKQVEEDENLFKVLESQEGEANE